MDLYSLFIHAGSAATDVLDSLTQVRPASNWLELSRVILFFGASIFMAAFSISAKVHNDRIWTLWAANSIYYSAMMYLLVLNQFVPNFAYTNRDIVTIPLLLVVLAAIAEWMRQRKLSKAPVTEFIQE